MVILSQAKLGPGKHLEVGPVLGQELTELSGGIGLQHWEVLPRLGEETEGTEHRQRADRLLVVSQGAVGAVGQDQ